MSNIIEREKLNDAYKNVLLHESKTGIRRKLQILDDAIDDFMDFLEKKADKIEDNPVFQRKVFQMIADASKEHAEFVMAMKRVASTLDSDIQTIPKTNTSMKFKKNVNPYDTEDEMPPNEMPPPEEPVSRSPSNEA